MHSINVPINLSYQPSLSPPPTPLSTPHPLNPSSPPLPPPFLPQAFMNTSAAVAAQSLPSVNQAIIAASAININTINSRVNPFLAPIGSESAAVTGFRIGSGGPKSADRYLTHPLKSTPAQIPFPHTISIHTLVTYPQNTHNTHYCNSPQNASPSSSSSSTFFFFFYFLLTRQREFFFQRQQRPRHHQVLLVVLLLVRLQRRRPLHLAHQLLHGTPRQQRVLFLGRRGWRVREVAVGQWEEFGSGADTFGRCRSTSEKISRGSS